MQFANEIDTDTIIKYLWVCVDLQGEARGKTLDRVAYEDVCKLLCDS